MIFILMLLCFFLRAIPRLRLKNVFLSDTYFHLYCSEVIRKNSFRLPIKLPRVILNHNFTYPFLYHYLLAVFPPQYRLWMERLTGAIFDTISVGLVYLFSLWAIQQGRDIVFQKEVPILIAAFYAFSPGLLRLGSGPRAYNGSPRVVGETLYLLHLLTAYYAYRTHSYPCLAVSLLAGATLIITAKFGGQVMLLFGVLFAAFVSYQYLFVLAACLLLAVVLTKGHAWKVIQGHIIHSIFYKNHLQAVFLYPNIRTFRQYLRSLFSAIWKVVRFFRLWEALQWYYKEQYFLHLLFTIYPQFVLCFYYILKLYPLNSLDLFLLVWMGAGLIWFFITKFRPFLFLGEGERYLEYALFPSIFMMIKYLSGKYELLWVFLIYSIFSAFFFLRHHERKYSPIEQDFNKSEAVFARLNRLPQGVIFPIGSFHYQTLYRSRFPVLTHGGNIDERLITLDEFMLVYGNYPYPSEHFHEIVNRYNVSYIVSDASALKYYREKVIKHSEEFDQCVHILWETPTLVVGKITK